MTENNLPPVIETPLVNNPATAEPKSRINIQTILIIILILALIGVSIAYAYNLSQQKQYVTNILPYPVEVPQSTPTSIVTIPDSNEFGNLIWLPDPKKVANPNILLSTTSPDTDIYSFSDTGTYQVGSFNSGASLLVTFIHPDNPSGPSTFRLIYDKGKYYLINSLISEDYIKKNIDQIFDKNKVKLISYQIKDLYPDTYYYLNQKSFSKNSYSSLQFITEAKNYSEVATTPIGPMLATYLPVTDFSDLKMRSYYLKLKDSTLVSYTQTSPLIMSDNRVPRFTLSDSTTNTNVFDVVRVGCGSGSVTSTVKNDQLLNGKVLIGKDDSTDIYQMKVASSPLVRYLYNQYKIGRDYPGGSSILSIDEFAQSPNHILYQERVGDWVLLVNPNYSMQAECGKPVIYLYPPKDTQVSVKVGADITKSEPLYPQDGWTVLAHPSGLLDYQNKSYPNLFWEGTGHGLYPNIGNKGFVVPQSKLISTLNFQLKQQGLNSQESADFMEFWTPELPTTPYVRLTWLTTQEMNILAPLQVNPPPQTVIRLFLDFEGLDKPIKLIPQKFIIPKRTGFTLVEWGGLLKR